MTQKDLKQLRKIYSVTPKQLDIILGFDPNTWSGYEKNIEKFDNMPKSKRLLIQAMTNVRMFYVLLFRHTPKCNKKKIGFTTFDIIEENARQLVSRLDYALDKAEKKINALIFKDRHYDIDVTPYIEPNLTVSSANKQIPSKIPIRKEFKGQCMGVGLSDRLSVDSHITVHTMVEDDGEWYVTNHFSSYWIDELIQKLQEANNYLKTQTPDIYDHKQYGYKFKKVKK